MIKLERDECRVTGDKNVALKLGSRRGAFVLEWNKSNKVRSDHRANLLWKLAVYDKELQARVKGIMLVMELGLGVGSKTWGRRGKERKVLDEVRVLVDFMDI